MNIWISKNQENILKKEGFNFPEYPEQGNVIFENQIVGYMSNFNGLMMRDYNSKASKFLKKNEINWNLCIWNPESN